MSALTEDDIALAGEYVFGLLDQAEAATVQARAAHDAGFAAEIARWQDRVSTMADDLSVPPPQDVWPAILAQTAPSSHQDNGAGHVRLWQGLTAASFAAMLVMAVMFFQRPGPVADAPTMVAALSSERNASAIAARYDATTGELLLTPVKLNTGPLYPELWVIPEDGKARSLGMMQADKTMRLVVPQAMRAHLHSGSVLAVTPEPLGGAPLGKATGPVIASGKMTLL